MIIMDKVYLNANAEIDEAMKINIEKNATIAISELLDVAKLSRGDILVVGCSSSEIIGKTIGKNSSFEAAKTLFDAIYSQLTQAGIYIASQCCEHLNRAVVIEKEVAEKCGYEPVCVVPQPKAGGSFATVTYQSLKNPVVVEHIRASAGIDIGGTLIGMHLKEVAVPVRLSISKIGEANIICARTRPKFIGGSRACYE